MSKLIDKAREMSAALHFGQKYSNKPYFDHHIEGVVSVLKKFHDHEAFDEETLLCAAYLHDAMEDCHVSSEFIANHFTPEVSKIVTILTRNKGESYSSYVGRVIEGRNTYAIRIKMADALFNLSECIFEGDASRIEKYGTVISRMSVA